MTSHTVLDSTAPYFQQLLKRQLNATVKIKVKKVAEKLMKKVFVENETCASR